MTPSYWATLALTFLTLVGLSTLVHANGRVSKDAKKRYYQICGVILFSAFWEWLAIFLNGAPAWTSGLHLVAKCMDYIFTPVCSVLFIRQFSTEGRGFKPMLGILGGNAAIQIFSIFTGWTFYLDAENYYHHGPLYFLYVIVSVLAVLFVIYAFYEYGKQYERQNRSSLFAISVLLVASVLMQELFSDTRIAYLGMSIASCMVFIHYTEFHQIHQDAVLKQQDRLLATDALTGVLSRFAYKQVVTDYNATDRLPDWLAAFEVDLNGLKTVNDTVGHEAGDELLRGTGAVLLQAIGSCGQVFRIGGDEFVILLDTRSMTTQQATD